MEEKKKIRWWIGKVAVFIERIGNSFNRRKKILWIDDGQGAVPRGQHLKLIAPVHGIELKKFFAKELQQQPQFGAKFKFNPFFFSWNICKAEIAEARREKEQRCARFMQYFKSKRD